MFLFIFFVWLAGSVLAAEGTCPNVVSLPVVECSPGMVSIKGLSRADVLRDLWWDTNIPGYYFLPGLPYDEELAEKAVDRAYIDYFLRKPIKMDLRKDCIDPRLYDRDSRWPARETIELLRRRVEGQCETE